MIALCLSFAALTEFGTDAYPTIGIITTEEVEVVDSTPSIECEEGKTWRCVIRENLQVEVIPGKEILSSQKCAGHEMEAAREDKGLVWFHNRSTAEELAAEIRKKLHENLDVDSKASLVQLMSKNGLYGVSVHLIHRENAPSCSNCRFHSAEPSQEEEWIETKIYRCPGHWRQVGGENIYSDGDNSEKRRQKAIAKLEQMRKAHKPKRGYAASEFYLHQHPNEDAMDFDIHGWIRHQDGEKKPCADAVAVFSYSLPQKTNERWVADKEIQINCPCIQEIYSSPGAKDCNGASIWRDAWKRVRVYECVNDSESSCEKCRREGGRLLSKECIKTAPDGRCVKWKKVYEMKKLAPFTKRIHLFEEGRAIFGFNGEFDHLKRGSNESDFSRAISALGAAASAYKEGDELLYQGQIVETRNSFPDERCHFVGLKTDGSGDVQFVYCCFAGKIARMIQEGAKSVWGSAENPNCGGLSQIDLEATDLSEMNDSILDAAFANKIREKMAGR